MENGATLARSNSELTAETDPFRVMIVDDHPIVRQGLCELIAVEHDLSVCGQAEDVTQARQLLMETEPDLVVLDLSLRDSDGIELIRDIRSRRGKLPVLVLSMHDENIYAERILGAGANGYIMKQAAADQLLVAVRRVLAGGIYVSEKVGARMIERFASGVKPNPGDPVERLSVRELQVLNLLGQGRTTREIAAALNLSTKTVESHRQRIKRKLNLETAPQLVQYAVSWLGKQH